MFLLLFLFVSSFFIQFNADLKKKHLENLEFQRCCPHGCAGDVFGRTPQRFELLRDDFTEFTGYQRQEAFSLGLRPSYQHCLG